MAVSLRGGLVGWKRTQTDHGIMLTLQVVDDLLRFRGGDVDRVELALNDRQLRSLVRDLTRAARDRNLVLGPFHPRWMFWRRHEDVR